MWMVVHHRKRLAMDEFRDSRNRETVEEQ
jgi:hypothetical protein